MHNLLYAMRRSFSYAYVTILATLFMWYIVYNVVLFEEYCRVSEVRGIGNVKCVRDGYHTVQAALLDYTLTCYPGITVMI